MKELHIDDKEVYLAENYPFRNPPKLEDEIVCIHCDAFIKRGVIKCFDEESGELFAVPNLQIAMKPSLIGLL